MDYGKIIERALKITWKHKYLWLVGILVGLGGGGGGGGGTNFSFPGSGDFSGGEGMPAPEVGERVAEWLATHIVLIVGLVLVLFVIGIILFLISSWAFAALIAEVKDIETEEQGAEGEANAQPAPRGFGRTMAKGREAFWRVVGLRLLVALIGFCYFLLIGLPLAAIIAAVVWKPTGALLITIVAGTILALALLAAIPFAVGLGLSVQFANRYLVIMNERIVAALRSGFELLRANLGPALLVWLISVGLGIGAAILLIFAMILVLIPLAIVVVLAFVGGGPIVGVVALVPLALFFLALVMTVSGALAAFYSSYWTLAFMGLAEKTFAEAGAAPAEA